MQSIICKNTTTQLIHSLAQKNSISQEEELSIQQINTLQFAGIIPPLPALLIKNNIQNTEYAESVLVDVILDLIQKEKLAPELKFMVSERKLHATIRFLYTCHLEQTYSTLEPYIIQQRLLGWPIQKLFVRMQESEEMENKKYIRQWLHSLAGKNPACQEALLPLLKPLTCVEFKKHLLHFLHTLQQQEPETVQSIALAELIQLLQNKQDKNILLCFSQFLKGFHFYKQYTFSQIHKDPQLSLCIAADALKNAPYASQLPTYYHNIYGVFKKMLTPPSILIAQGTHPDDSKTATALAAICEKLHKPYQIVDLSTPKSASQMIQHALKKGTSALLAASSTKIDMLLSTAKALHVPLLFFPSYTEPKEWEKIGQEPHHPLHIAFPTPPTLIEDLPSSTIHTAGVACLFSSPVDKTELRKKWGFTPETKIITLLAPESDSPWLKTLIKDYENQDNIALVLLTDTKQSKLTHKIKTQIQVNTKLPIHVFPSPSPEERQELLQLSHVLIAKAPRNNHHLLFEAFQAKTALLLDRSPYSSLTQVLYKNIAKLFYSYKTNPEEEIQEKIMSDLNLGLFIRSTKHLKSAVEELFLHNPKDFPSLPSFSESSQQLLHSLPTNTVKNEITISNTI